MNNSMKFESNRIMNERPLAEGISVSNDTRQTLLNNNDLIIGPSGAGKTGGYVIPNLLALQGSVIVADTKSNLRRQLAPVLESRGYEIHTVNFVHPDQSVPYNPLDYITTDDDGELRDQDIMTIAAAMVSNLDSEEPFWETSARTVMACLIAYVKEVFPKDEQNLNTVAAVFRVMNNQYAEQKNLGNYVIPFLEEFAAVKPDSFCAKKYGMFKGCLPADRTWACVTQFVSSAIDVFDFRQARALFGGKPVFQFGDLGHKKMAVFLNISDTDRTLDRIINLFYTQALQALCREADSLPDSRMEVPVRLILDDFATNAFIPDFDKTISVIRSREISVSVILQSLTQLETMYSAAAATTIVNNCDHVLYLGGNDRKTAEFVSLYTNKPVEQVLSMPLDKVCLITRGQKALLTDKIVPYAFEIPKPAAPAAPAKPSDEDKQELDWDDLEQFLADGEYPF